MEKHKLSINKETEKQLKNIMELKNISYIDAINLVINKYARKEVLFLEDVRRTVSVIENKKYRFTCLQNECFVDGFYIMII